MKRPPKKQLKYDDLFKTFRVFGRHYRSHWKLLAAAYTALFSNVIIALLLPWPLKLILDFVILQHPIPEPLRFLTDWFASDHNKLLLAIVVAFVLLNVLDKVISYLHKVGMLVVRAKMAAEIRDRIFAHLQRLSLSFHGSSRAGDLMYRLTSDIENLMAMLIEIPKNFIHRFVLVLSHVVLMLILEWRLALIAMSVVPLLYLYNRWIGRNVQSATREQRNRESNVASLVAENVTSMALIQSYGREDLQQSRLESENRESLSSALRAIRLAKIHKRIGHILIACATAGVVYFGGKLAMSGAILPGDIVLFTAYLRKLYNPIKKLTDMLLLIAKSQVAGHRILEIIESNMIIEDAPNAVAAPRFRGEIQFCDVSFSYHPGKPVLEDLNFSIHPGETIALVGPSGAGKSTIINLLLRFYDPQFGFIRIDGVDVREYTLRSLRDQITVLLQDSQLFNKTVAENIAFGRPWSSRAEIIEAATRASAHGFISEMPHGYDSIIEEDGENLSGGQKQRINMARAMIRQTPILILDEPATALDIVTEEQINQALEELTRGKTTFIIAHKLSTISHADRILLLENGRLTAMGSHAELSRNSRPYQEHFDSEWTQRTISSESSEMTLSNPEESSI